MFKRRFASDAWMDQRRLAELCEIARLSEIQAEVTRLTLPGAFRPALSGLLRPFTGPGRPDSR